MAHIELFSIGNALVDQEFLVDEQFLEAAKLHKGTMQLCDAEQQAHLVQQLATAVHKGQSSGGSAANTTVAFSALGGSSFYACRVGNDELAHFYLQDLQQVQVQTHQKSISEGQTGTCIVMITPDGERTMCTYLGITAELGCQQVEYAALAQAKWLYIEGYLASSITARQAVFEARQIARQHQVKIALSLSDPAMVNYAREGLDALIGDGVDLLFCNEQEALMYSQQSEVAQAAQHLLQRAEIVVITLGGRGALLCTRQAASELIVGQQVQVLDTNGAGDAFAGGFLYALTRQWSLQQAAQLGNKVAAQVVSQYGARLSYAQFQDIAQQF